MKDMGKLKELLCRELEEYERRDHLTMSDLETVNKLTDTIKNLGKIEMLEEDGGGYSHRGGMPGNGGNMGGGSYSYRGRRRDSRGRYSRGGGYSYDDGKRELMELIDEMMEDADGREREVMRRFKEEMQR